MSIGGSTSEPKETKLSTEGDSGSCFICTGSATDARATGSDWTGEDSFVGNFVGSDFTGEDSFVCDFIGSDFTGEDSFVGDFIGSDFTGEDSFVGDFVGVFLVAVVFVSEDDEVFFGIPLPSFVGFSTPELGLVFVATLLSTFFLFSSSLDVLLALALRGGLVDAGFESFGADEGRNSVFFGASKTGLVPTLAEDGRGAAATFFTPSPFVLSSLAVHDGLFRNSRVFNLSSPSITLCWGAFPGKNSLLMFSLWLAGCQTNNVQIDIILGRGTLWRDPNSVTCLFHC